jgi:branched-chain amino acid transport system permease protein
VQVLNSIFQNYEPAFGGPKGIPNISKFSFMGITFTSYKEWFYLLFILIIVLGIIVERIRRTKLGRSLASIRDNEIAAQTLGVNIYKTRVISFIISGALAGLSGSLLAFHTGFVSADLFTFTKSSTLVVMSMLGGINSTIGIIVGALLVTFLPEALRGLDNYLMMIYGFIVIIMMIFMPMGIGGIASDWARSMRRKRVLSANSGREEKP